MKNYLKKLAVNLSKRMEGMWGVKGLVEDFQKLSVLVWEDFPKNVINPLGFLGVSCGLLFESDRKLNG